jgi:type VII secretion protein EccE
VAGIPAGLLVCWQAALLLALVAIGRPAGTVIVLGVVAAATVAVTGWRPGGRWAHEWLLLWLRYQLRSGREPEPGQPPPLAVLAVAAGVETVDEVETEGDEVALIAHRHGLTAVLELDAGDPATDLVRLPLLLAPPAEPEAPAVSVQLLVHTGAAGQPASEWLAVQVRRDANHPVEELRSGLVSTVRRLRRRLRPEDRRAALLDRAGLTQALHALTWLEPVPATRAAGPAGTERWDTWWTGTVPQRTLAVRSWPGLPAPPDRALVDTLLAGTGTVSLAAQRRRLAAAHGTLGAGDEAVAVELMVRLAAPDQPALAAATRQLADRLAGAGGRAERLDGRQLPGLAGTLPLGGFLAGYPPVAGAFARPPRALPAPATPAAAPPAAAPPAAAPATAPAPPAPLAPAPVATPAAPAPPAPGGLERPPMVVPLPEPAEPRFRPSEPGQVPAPAVRAKAQVPVPPAAEPAGEAPPAPEPPQPAYPARGQAAVPAALTGLSQARGQAQVHPPVPAPVQRPAAGPPDRPAAGPPDQPAAGPPDQPGGAGAAPPPEPAPPPGMPTALPGVAPAPAPVSPAPAGGSPYPPPPDPHRAVRAYGASLFTAESPDRAQVDQLIALARTPQPAPQVVSVVAGRPGLGASTTAAGLARTLATVRDDHTALLGGTAGPVDAATIAEVRREHAFTVVDLGAHPGEETPMALAASTRVLVVTSADRRATAATRLLLDRIHQVHPALTSSAVIAVVCRNAKQYRRVSRELSSDRSPQASQIIPVPHDPAVQQVDHVDLTRLRTATREAYLRLAAAVALPPPVTAGAPLGYLPTHL